MGGKAKWAIGPGGHLVLSARKMEHFFGPENAARIQLCSGCFLATIHHPHPNPTKNSLICGMIHLALLFRIDKSSRGVSRIDEATPWDACPYA